MVESPRSLVCVSAATSLLHSSVDPWDHAGKAPLDLNAPLHAREAIRYNALMSYMFASEPVGIIRTSPPRQQPRPPLPVVSRIPPVRQRLAHHILVSTLGG
jgi:hypothetical protein